MIEKDLADESSKYHGAIWTVVPLILSSIVFSSER